MPETREEPERCPSCMVPFESHLGLVGTCRQVQDLRERLAVVERERDAVAMTRIVQRTDGKWSAYFGGAFYGPFDSEQSAIAYVVKRSCKAAGLGADR